MKSGAGLVVTRALAGMGAAMRSALSKLAHIRADLQHTKCHRYYRSSFSWSSQEHSFCVLLSRRTSRRWPRSGLGWSFNCLLAVSLRGPATRSANVTVTHGKHVCGPLPL